MGWEGGGVYLEVLLEEGGDGFGGFWGLFEVEEACGGGGEVNFEGGCGCHFGGFGWGWGGEAAVGWR